jgi:GYD domain
MLTRLPPEALAHPESVVDLNRQMEDHLKRESPEVTWLANYAVLGPYDYLDSFEAPAVDTATKVALLVRSFGHANTETWSSRRGSALWMWPRASRANRSRQAIQERR